MTPWDVTAVVTLDSWDQLYRPASGAGGFARRSLERNYGAAVDIGTTTVTVWLVDLQSGEVVAQATMTTPRFHAARMSSPGSSMPTSGITWPSCRAWLSDNQPPPGKRMSAGGRNPDEVFKLTIAANPTMIHPPLAIPPDQIRLAPFIPAVNHTPTLVGGELGLAAHPQALVDCLPGVASYAGADISAGVLSTAQLDESVELTLFIDVGTNGEIVLGNADWLITCACSAGPAFDGRGRGARYARDPGRHRRGVDSHRYIGAHVPGHRQGGRKAQRDLWLRPAFLVGPDVRYRRSGQGGQRAARPFVAHP